MTLPALPIGYRGLAAVNNRRFSSLRRELTIKGFNPQEREEFTVEAWRATPHGYGIPRAYATQRDIPFPTESGYRIDPQERPEFAGKWAYQERPVEQAVELFKGGVKDLIFQGYTGSGKTVMGCEIAARLGVSTLIFVDQNKLMRQWEETLEDHFGYDKSEIGSVQGQTLDFENDFTIAMIQSVYDSGFDDEFYRAFGLVIFDECHVAGADQFSNILEMFPARYRMGMSATPDRKDALKKLLSLHLEEKRVVLKEARQVSRVYVVQNDYTGSWYANTSPKTGRFVSEIVEDSSRNELLLEIIQWFHGQNRKALIIGERIQHLENLAAMAVRAGIPEEAICLYTGKEHYYKLEKNPEPTRDPDGWEKGTEYTPLHFKLKERKVKLEKRDDMLTECRLIFSTYSVFSKGVDIPDLDAGLDATPRSAAIQMHGRILRIATGKRIPIWVTLRDYNSTRAEYQFSKRVMEFAKSNAEIFIWPQPGEGELIRRTAVRLRKEAEWRREKLKDVRITTDAGGTYTIQTPLIDPEFLRNNVNRTTRREARSRRS